MKDIQPISEQEFIRETYKHIYSVRQKMGVFMMRIGKRALEHDQSKLEDPEKTKFREVTPRLRGLTYGSEEYKSSLKDLGEALDHHYKNNSHHPEHFSNGIAGMDLLDVVEMFCDWLAAVERHEDGDIMKSINHNKERFGISDQLVDILKNTVKRW